MQKENSYVLFAISICLVGASIIKYSICALWKEESLGEFCSRIETTPAQKTRVYTSIYILIPAQCTLGE